MNSHWSDIHRVWSHYTPPLRPTPEVVAEMRRQIAGADRTLLLGVTPELADIAQDVVAIDRSIPMVRHLWPGNSPARRVVAGDWLNCNFVRHSFASCIGDGSLNAVRFPEHLSKVCENLADVLRPGGRIVFRVFVAPDEPEDIAVLKEIALQGKIRNFHAFKWRLAAAMVSARALPNLPMGTVYEMFCKLFPDWLALISATGWKREEVETINYLKNSTAVSTFPRREELQAVISRSFADARFLAVGGYELAERCPLLVAKRD